MTESDIERSSGTVVGGYRVGGGYRGKRDDQDEAVCEFAERLSDMFPHDVTIRYNSNRLGGGAWLKDGKRNAQVGLGAELKPPESHKEQFQEYLDNGLDDDLKPKSIERMDPDELVLRFSVHVVPPAIDEEHCNRDGGFSSDSYAHRLFDDFETAWDWFTEHVERDGVNPPAGD